MSAVHALTDARALPAFSGGHRVVIRWRPPCLVEKQELFAGPVTADGLAGVDPGDVVKAICRTLDCGPGALAFEPDEQAVGLKGNDARCYLVDAAGERIAHIAGDSFAWLQVSASRLAARDWRPGMNREVVLTDHGAIA